MVGGWLIEADRPLESIGGEVVIVVIAGVIVGVAIVLISWAIGQIFIWLKLRKRRNISYGKRATRCKF